MLVFLAGCSSAPVKTSDLKEGQWRGKALIKDKEQNRSYIVNLNFNVQDANVRMDVTTTLGNGVASLLTNNKEVHYVLFDSKRFYYGQPQPGVMRPILALPFDPRWIQNVLFDIPIAEKSWSCTTGSDGFLAECSDSVTGIKIAWTGRQGQKKTVLIEHGKASVQINLQSFRPKVEERKSLFSLEAPEGYQKLRVR